MPDQSDINRLQTEIRELRAEYKALKFSFDQQQLDLAETKGKLATAESELGKAKTRLATAESNGTNTGNLLRALRGANGISVNLPVISMQANAGGGKDVTITVQLCQDGSEVEGDFVLVGALRAIDTTP